MKGIARRNSFAVNIKDIKIHLLEFPFWISGYNLTSNYESMGSIPDLAQWVKGPSVAMSCSVGHKRGSDPTLLWL